jgi:phosphatidylglycerophosphate synthase
MEKNQRDKPNLSSRRPIKSRESTWAKKLTTSLINYKLTADTISWASMLFATFGFLGFCLAGKSIPWWAGMLFGIIGIQGRLICNLLDGMVAQESGQKSHLGKILNEVPDRYSDIILLLGAGIAIEEIWLGWMAACFAVLTAYIRSFGAEGSGHKDFGGPMAKPQRMFFLSLGSLCAIFYPDSLLIALYLIAIGSILTSAIRLYKMTEGQKSSL